MANQLFDKKDYFEFKGKRYAKGTVVKFKPDKISYCGVATPYGMYDGTDRYYPMNKPDGRVSKLLYSISDVYSAEAFATYVEAICVPVYWTHTEYSRLSDEKGTGNDTALFASGMALAGFTTIRGLLWVLGIGLYGEHKFRKDYAPTTYIERERLIHPKKPILPDQDDITDFSFLFKDIPRTEPKVSREEKKQEAAYRMSMIDRKNDIRDFLANDDLWFGNKYTGESMKVFNAKETPCKREMRMKSNKVTAKLITDFENATNAIVYDVPCDLTDFGAYDALLYVSDNKENWAKERADIINGEVRTMMYNRKYPEESRMGTLKFTHCTVTGKIFFDD